MECCTKIGCCGGSYLVQRGVLELSNGTSDHIARSPFSFPVTNRGGNRGFGAAIAASMAEAVVQHTGIEKETGRSSGGGGGGVDRRSAVEMDRWMRESVVEIVKNLVHAPLLVHVYGGGGQGRVVVVVGKAEEWEDVKGKWRRGEAEVPEGMIFVEELAAGEECGCGGGEGTSAWGLVVQGKGVETGPVCYLLKTTRVGSGTGSGSGSGSGTGVGGSTHFCLMRVSNFTETAESQLMNCWIVERGQRYGFSSASFRASKW